jgi:hypothetical protein
MRLGRFPRGWVSDAVLLEGTKANQAMPHFSRVFLPRLSRLAFTLVRPAVFVPLMLGTVALGYALPSTDSALARCEMRGGSVTECRLIVLGR